MNLPKILGATSILFLTSLGADSGATVPTAMAEVFGSVLKQPASAPKRISAAEFEALVKFGDVEIGKTDLPEFLKLHPDAKDFGPRKDVMHVDYITVDEVRRYCFQRSPADPRIVFRFQGSNKKLEWIRFSRADIQIINNGACNSGEKFPDAAVRGIAIGSTKKEAIKAFGNPRKESSLFLKWAFIFEHTMSVVSARMEFGKVASMTVAVKSTSEWNQEGDDFTWEDHVVLPVKSSAK